MFLVRRQASAMRGVGPDRCCRLPRLRTIGPQVRRHGKDVTLVGAGWTTKLALEAGVVLERQGISAEVIDLRVINPIDHEPVVASVRKTGRLVAIDGGWSNCGLAAEIVAGAAERTAPGVWRAPPRRVTLAEAPAPTSRALEKLYYPSADSVVREVLDLMASFSDRVPKPVS